MSLVKKYRDILAGLKGRRVECVGLSVADLTALLDQAEGTSSQADAAADDLPAVDAPAEPPPAATELPARIRRNRKLAPVTDA